MSKELVCSPESPIRPPIELDRSDSDSYDFALENNETFQDQENHPSSVKVCPKLSFSTPKKPPHLFVIRTVEDEMGRVGRIKHSTED